MSSSFSLKFIFSQTWLDWLTLPIWRRVNPKSKSKHKKSFSTCSSFKHIHEVLTEEPEPASPKSPSILQRTWIRSRCQRYDQSSIRLPSRTVVIYFTSLRVVRRTFHECSIVQSILRVYRVPIDERDLSMDTKFMEELQAITGCTDVKILASSLPKVFINGRYIGGAEEIKQLHETGELLHLMAELPSVSPTSCAGCGGLRFVLCDICNGSHKIYKEEECGFVTCNSCNINGLSRCPFC